MLLYHTIHIKINYFMIYQPNVHTIQYNIIPYNISYHIWTILLYNVHYVQNILLKYTTIHAIYYRYILSSQSNIISIFLFSPFSTVKISSNERVPPRVPHSTLSTRVAILSTGTRARKLSRKDSRLQATILVLLPPKSTRRTNAPDEISNSDLLSPGSLSTGKRFFLREFWKRLYFIQRFCYFNEWSLGVFELWIGYIWTCFSKLWRF